MTNKTAAHRFLKFLLAFFASIIALFILLVLLLPSLLSSNWAKTKLIDLVNQSIPGHVEVNAISLGWFGPQEINTFVLKDPQGHEVVSIQKGVIGTSLFSLLWDPLATGKVEIVALNANITTDDHNITNIEKSLSKDYNGRSATSTPLAANIWLKDIQAQVNLASNELPSTLIISGKTLQGSLAGNFSINAEMSAKATKRLLSQSDDLTAALQAAENALKLHIDIINFPVALFDQLFTSHSPHFSGLIKQTLGPELNLSVKQVSNNQGISLQLRAKTANFSAEGDARVFNDFSLATPLLISLKLTPALFEAFSQNLHEPSPWKLDAPVDVKLAISQLQMPLADMPFGSKKSGLDLTKLAVVASVDIAEASVTNKAKQQTQVAVQKLHADLTTTQGSKTAALTVNGQAKHRGQSSLINMTATIPKQAAGADYLQGLWEQLILQAKISNLPLASLDEHLGLNGHLKNALGISGDMTASVEPSEKGSLLQLQWKSELLEISKLTFQLNNQLELRQPGSIKWQITPEWLNSITAADSVKLQANTTATLVLNKFSIPSPFIQNNENISENLTLSSELTFNALTLQGQSNNVGQVNVNDLALHISAAPRSPFEIALTSNLSQTDVNGAIFKLLGDITKVESSASLIFRQNKPLAIDNFRFSLKSNLAQMQLTGNIRDGNTLVLTTPATLIYTLTPPALNVLGMTTEGYLFEHKKPLVLTVAPSRIPLSFEDLSHLKIGGALKVDDLYITHRLGNKSSQAVIDHCNADWLVDASKELLSLNFIADTRLEQEAAGTVKGNLSIRKWLKGTALDIDQVVIDASATASKLPVEILNVLTGNKNLLPLIGDAIDITTVVEYTPSSKRGSFLLDLKSPHLKANANFSIDQVIKLRDKQFPAEIALQLTPRGYSVLRQWMDVNYNDDFSLSETANVFFRLNALTVPLGGEKPQPSALMNAAFDFTFSIDHLTGVNNKTKQKVFLNNLQSQLTSKNLSKHLAFNIEAKGQNEQGIVSAWSATGSMDNGFSPDGSINADALTLALEATVDTVPLGMLCQFICVDHNTLRQFEAVIGKTMNAKVKTKLQQMNGFFYIDLKGENGNLLLDSTITKGILQLNKDLEAHVTITPQLSEYVLQEFFPILDGMVDADQPLKLTIDRQGFAMPIKDPSPSSITISKATLDAGKVHVTSQSELAKVLSLLGSFSNNKMVVWLTPLYFSIANGVVKIERVDILINERYPVAAWGKVDIPKDNVNMVIALSGAAIIQAFKVPGISNSYFLQLPLKGTLNKAEIDKTKAAARISALVAQARGGAHGAVIGTVLHIASGGLTEGSAPKPTTQPLPWEKMLQDASSNTTNSSGDASDADTSSTNSTDAIKKGASSLIKQFFR